MVEKNKGSKDEMQLKKQETCQCVLISVPAGLSKCN
jgi:hypothetical protein